MDTTKDTLLGNWHELKGRCECNGANSPTMISPV